MCALSLVEARACTIFVLTDAEHTLFFNNEDFSNSATRLWFVPGGADFFGCAFVGFDDGWAQGGCNTEGLAFDWVAGAMEPWQLSPDLQRVRGNPAVRMLETCATVEAAVAFFETHWEPGFARGRILVADRTGASVVIGAKQGKLVAQRSHESRGFGYGGQVLAERLAQRPAPTVAAGLDILRACVQGGRDATQYSAVYDLRTSELFLAPSPLGGKSFRLELQRELAKGGHFNDLPKLARQIDGPVQPLLPNQTRFYLDQFPVLAAREPVVTELVRRLITHAAGGGLRQEDCTDGFWHQIAARRKEMQAAIQQLGNLGTITLVGRSEKDGVHSYRFILEFAKARVLQRYDLAEQGKVAAIESEFVELQGSP